MAKKKAPVTVDEIKEAIAQAEKLFGPMHLHFKVKRDFAELKYAIDAPPEIVRFKNMTPATKVQKAANQLITDIPNFEIGLPYNHGKRDEERRDLQKRLANLIFKQSESKNNIPPFRDCAINMPKYGAAALKVEWDADYDKEQQHIPIVVTSLNPENCYPISRRQFAEVYNMSVLSLEELVEDWNTGKNEVIAEYMKPKGKSADAPVSLVKYYNDKVRCFLADGKPLFVKGIQENILGEIPQEYRVSGWAGKSSEGSPEDEARGINDLCFDAYRQMSLIESLMTAQAATDTVGKWWQKEGADIAWPDLLWQPVVSQNFDDFKQLELSKINTESYRLLGLLREQVDDQTFQASIGGKSQADSGTHEATLIAQDLKMLRTPRSQIESMVEAIWEKSFRLAKKFGPIYYHGRKIITVDDIILPIMLNVSLQAVDPIRKQAENLMLLKMLVAGAISWENFALKSGLVDDLTTERKLILIDQIMRQPALIQLLGQKALEEWGIREQIATLQSGGGHLPLDDIETSMGTRASRPASESQQQVGDMGSFTGANTREAGSMI